MHPLIVPCVVLLLAAFEKTVKIVVDAISTLTFGILALLIVATPILDSRFAVVLKDLEFLVVTVYVQMVAETVGVVLGNVMTVLLSAVFVSAMFENSAKSLWNAARSILTILPQQMIGQLVGIPCLFALSFVLIAAEMLLTNVPLMMARQIVGTFVAMSSATVLMTLQTAVAALA